VSGSLRTLTENQDEAFRLLKLALTAPVFDAEDVERRRRADFVGVATSHHQPERNSPASAGGQPPSRATPTRVRHAALGIGPSHYGQDLRAFVRKVLARDNLKIAIVGNIDAAAAGTLIDRVFGSLPAQSALSPVANASPQGLGQKIASTSTCRNPCDHRGAGILRKDPDFMAAFVLNHILGGSAFSVPAL